MSEIENDDSESDKTRSPILREGKNAAEQADINKSNHITLSRLLNDYNNPIRDDFYIGPEPYILEFYNSGIGTQVIGIEEFFQIIYTAGYPNRKDALYKTIYDFYYKQGIDSKYAEWFRQWEEFTLLPMKVSYNEWLQYKDKVVEYLDEYKFKPHLTEKTWQLVNGTLSDHQATEYIHQLLWDTVCWLHDEDKYEDDIEQWKARDRNNSELLFIYDCGKGVKYFGLDDLFELMVEEFDYGLQKNLYMDPKVDDVYEAVFHYYIPLPENMAALASRINGHGYSEDRVCLPDIYRKIIKQFLHNALERSEKYFEKKTKLIRIQLGKEPENRDIDIVLSKTIEHHPVKKMVCDFILMYSGYSYSFQRTYLEYLSTKFGKLDFEKLPENESAMEFYYGDRLNSEPDVEYFIKCSVVFFGEQMTMKLIDKVCGQDGLIPGEKSYDLYKLWLPDFRKLSLHCALDRLKISYSGHGFGSPDIKLEFVGIDINPDT